MAGMWRFNLVSWWTNVVLVVVVVVVLLSGPVGGQTDCSFPSDIRGNWTSSRYGVLGFNDTHISGRVVCPVCPVAELESWSCWEQEGDKYIVSAVTIDISGLKTYFFTCLYLYRVSATKYIYYYGPQNKHGVGGDYVIIGTDSTVDFDTACNLATPLPPERYHVLVKEDSISSSSSLCPSELLGNFVPADSTSCDALVEVCGDQHTIQVTNSTISPDLFLSVNGSLKCMYSLRDYTQEVTYVTVYNMDDTLAADDTGFTCVAIFQSGDQVSLTQQAGDCIDLQSPNVTTPVCVLNATFECPVTCDFSSSLIGSWISTRKGDVTISTDVMTGFEPTGVDCNTTTCNTAPSSFHCYMKDNDKYLIRTDAVTIDTESVRIYVCLQFSKKSSSKYIYHHDHSNTHATLEEYLVTLNSAAPVDGMSEVCEGISTFDPPLYSVFMKSGSVSDSQITCPSDLDKIYNVSNSQCEYSFDTCDDPTQIKLSSTTCNSLPFYTENGTVNCLYSTTSGDTTYLTLYNTDSFYTDGDTYMFSCIAYALSDSSILRFSQTPYGCHKNQTTTNTTTDQGMSFVFDSQGSCPSSDDFPWIYIVIALVALLVLIILIVIIWYCCCRRKRKAKKGDEEAITDDSSVQSRGSDEGHEVKKGGVRRLMDVFTIGKDKKKQQAKIRDLERSKLKRGKGRPGDEESLDSGVTGDEAVKSRRRRKRKGRRRKRRKRVLEDGTEEYLSTDAEDDDGYNEYDSEYSDTYDSDEYESCTDTDGGSESSQKKHHSKKSKAHQLHIAKAWEKRKNDPNLVKSTGSPIKGREGDGGVRVEGDFDPETDLLPGQIVPITSILSKRSPLRARGDRQSSRMSSARSNIRFIGSPLRQKPTIDQRLDEARERYLNNIPHLGLYVDYTDKRQQLEDEGFWDDLQAQRTASQIFHLDELDEALQKIDTDEGAQSKGNDVTSSAADQASLPGSVSRPSTSTHRGQDSKSEDTLTTGAEDNAGGSTRRGTVVSIVGHSNMAADTERESVKTDNKEIQTNSDEEFESNIVAQSIADYEYPRDIKSPGPQEKVTFVGSANIMARFYSRLNQIRNAKADTDSSGTPSDTTPTEKTDKRRIRTALRRLLAERLFPDIRPATPVKPLPSSNGDTAEFDLVTSGTATPFTGGARSRSSKTALSQLAKNDNPSEDKRQSTANSKSRVLFVENSDVSDDNFTTGDVTISSNASRKQPTPGYYRRHEGPVTNPNSRSRLYQPSRGHGRVTLASNPSSRDAILKDPDFIKSLRNQIGKHNDKSSPQAFSQPPGRPHLSWAYNTPPPLVQRTRGSPSRRGAHSVNPSMSRADFEDWQLKKLLEELYQDKKYMDTLISTKGDNPTEQQVSQSLQEGRDYLLDRAAYWLERGPLPPRPPTSELGFRLEREQSTMSVRSVRMSDDSSTC